MGPITFGTTGGIWKERDATLEFAQYAERLGFDMLSFGEHVTNWGPDYDPFIQMAYVTAATKRIRLATQVTVLPLHHPVRLAHQITTLDNLSDGRVTVGIGVGGEFPKQYEAFGIPVSERGKRTDEYIEILRGLWTEASFTYRGNFFQFEDITMEPKPSQKPHPPIWVGGRPGGVETAPDGTTRYKSKAGAVRRAARYGQGWIPYYVTVEQVRTTVEQLHQFAREEGRDPGDITIGLNNMWLAKGSFQDALEVARDKNRYSRDISERVSRYDLLGSPKDIIRRAEAYIDAGVTHFACLFLCDPEEVSEQMEIVAREVIPHFR